MSLKLPPPSPSTSTPSSSKPTPFPLKRTSTTTTPSASSSSPPSSSVVVPKGDVARQASKVHGPWLASLEGRERLVVLGHLSSLMRGLGMKRREGMFARERLATLVDLMVDARQRSVVQPNVDEREQGGGSGEVGVRVGAGKDGNEAVLRVLKGVLEGLGVDLEEGEGVWDVDGGGAGGARRMDVGRGSGGGEGEEEGGSGGRGRFGWPELQLRAMRDAIGIAEVLPDHASVVLFSLTALRTLHPFIVPGEQAHLAALFPRALATARRRGELVGEGKLKFWAGWIVLSLEVGSLPPTHVPIEHGIQDRTIAQSLTATGLVRDPFLYNPRSKSASLTKSIVVQNETLEFLITLQNPFAFELEIQDIRLSTTGVPFTSHPCPAILLPNAFQTIRVTGFASSPGTLTVQGCFVRLPDGSEAEFLLPVHDAAEEKRQRKRESLNVERERAMKLRGMEARPSERRKRESEILESGIGGGKETEKEVVGGKGKEKEVLPVQGFLSCEVVPEQPLVRIRGSSLTHGAIMLYDGEESTIRITLENTSSLPVDFVQLSFQDSTTGRSQAIISEGERDLSAGEAYEIESDLVNRPVFKWDQQKGESIRIPPGGGRQTINVKCLGKVGCVHGSIIINYAYLDRPGQDRPTSYFHTRQITFPLLISVYPTLECTSLDILRLPTSSKILATTPSASGSTLKELGEEPLEVALRREEDEEDHCLFAVDVRNVYGQPFEVTFERKEGESFVVFFFFEQKVGNADFDVSFSVRSLSGDAPFSSTRLIPPGSTERIVLPIHRMLLPRSKSSSPIPSLAERQFVVSRSTASKAEESLTRSLFWYREELLSLVQASWKEPGTSRKGTLSLRSQRVTEPMLEVLRADEVVLRLDVDGPLSFTSSNGTPPVVPANDFFNVNVRIKNRLGTLSSFSSLLLSSPTPKKTYPLPLRPSSQPIPSTLSSTSPLSPSPLPTEPGLPLLFYHPPFHLLLLRRRRTTIQPTTTLCTTARSPRCFPLGWNRERKRP
ncbi:TRAPP II complex [Mrakia frigida]|uniref:TRAPP II complex n=1 Tax=Mrakia frigida TaxID=29902 RepID=UPI003FCC0218